VAAAGQHLAARALDPDDVGAEVGQDHARMRARPDPGDLDDPDSLERAGALSQLNNHARIMTDSLSRLLGRLEPGRW
jgi:hypothetical protein